MRSWFSSALHVRAQKTATNTSTKNIQTNLQVPPYSSSQSSTRLALFALIGISSFVSVIPLQLLAKLDLAEVRIHKHTIDFPFIPQLHPFLMSPWRIFSKDSIFLLWVRPLSSQ